MKYSAIISTAALLAGLASAHAQTTITASSTGFAYTDYGTGDWNTTGVGTSGNSGTVRLGKTNQTPNRLNRGFIAFDLDDSLTAADIASAELRFSIIVINNGPDDAQLFHGASVNRTDILASDFENTAFLNTGKIAATNASSTGVHLSVDVTDQIIADYNGDGVDAIAFFQFRVENDTTIAGSASGGGNLRYELNSKNAAANLVPELIITTTTIPEPSFYAVALCVPALFVLGRRFKQGRKG